MKVYDMTIFYWKEDMINAYNGAGCSMGGTAKDPVRRIR